MSWGLCCLLFRLSHRGFHNSLSSKNFFYMIRPPGFEGNMYLQWQCAIYSHSYSKKVLVTFLSDKLQRVPHSQLHGLPFPFLAIADQAIYFFFLHCSAATFMSTQNIHATFTIYCFECYIKPPYIMHSPSPQNFLCIIC